MNNLSKHKILLLSCCAPCSCAVIEKLKAEGVDFSVLFYNPNIHPKEEYIKRRDEQKALCQRWQIDFIELEYDIKNWLSVTAELKDEPERGKRCFVCFKFRLLRAMEYAKEHGYSAVSSVLGVSRYKDLAQVNAAAASANELSGVEYIEIEGRKQGMQQRREELIKELDLYRQKYCGCIYSMKQIP